MNKKDEALKRALSTLANARDWIGNAPDGRWDEDEMYDELCNMVKFVSKALAEPPANTPLTDEVLQKHWPKVWPEQGAFVRASADDLREFAHGIKGDA